MLTTKQRQQEWGDVSQQLFDKERIIRSYGEVEFNKYLGIGYDQLWGGVVPGKWTVRVHQRTAYLDSGFGFDPMPKSRVRTSIFTPVTNNIVIFTSPEKSVWGGGDIHIPYSGGRVLLSAHCVDHNPPERREPWLFHITCYAIQLNW